MSMLPVLIKGDSSLVPDSCPESHIELTKAAGRGATWKVWRGIQDGQSVVVKLVAPTITQYEEDTRRQVMTEWIALRRLQDVRGSVVVKHHGIYGSVQEHQEVWAFIAQDAGNEVDVATLSLDQK